VTAATPLHELSRLGEDSSSTFQQACYEDYVEIAAARGRDLVKTDHAECVEARAWLRDNGYDRGVVRRVSFRVAAAESVLNLTSSQLKDAAAVLRRRRVSSKKGHRKFDQFRNGGTR